MQSDWAYQGALNYPLKVREQADGSFKVTSVYVRGQEWTGDSEESAIRHARNEIERIHGERELDTRPQWMVDGEAKWCPNKSGK